MGYFKTLKKGVFPKVLVAYPAIALSWSLLAFLTPERLPFTAEYVPNFLVVEVGGHFLFGALVGVFTWKGRGALLCGYFAATIDADHMVSLFITPVLDRTAHSVFFVLFASLIICRITGERRWLKLGVFAMVASSVLSHMSYDTFLNNGNFPIFAPLSFQIYAFPYWSWLPLELVGMAVNLIAFRALKGRDQRPGPNRGFGLGETAQEK